MALAKRRRAGVWVLGALGVGVVAGTGVWVSGSGRKAAVSPTRSATEAPATLTRLAQEVRRGDDKALGELEARLSRAEAPTGPVGEAEAEGWVEMLKALRWQFPRLAPAMRMKVLTMASIILDKFAVQPVPGNWLGILEPSHNILTAGLADPDPTTRASALALVTKLWGWNPGSDLASTRERDQMTAWRRGLHPSVVQDLSHPDAKVRAAAVQCLAALLPFEDAAPALNLIRDDEAIVRLQVLSAFAEHRGILTEEMLLPLLHDPHPSLAALAVKVLESRGLTPDQINLCKRIGDPDPSHRAETVPILADRTDIEPVLWLIYLTRDPEESVRLKAVGALAGRDTPEARTRLAELATSDPSAAVRAAAGKLAPAGESTVALPPLPGSPSLTPKAN